jgi:hypothetical protein
MQQELLNSPLAIIVATTNDNVWVCHGQKVEKNKDRYNTLA